MRLPPSIARDLVSEHMNAREATDSMTAGVFNSATFMRASFCGHTVKSERVALVRLAANPSNFSISLTVIVSSSERIVRVRTKSPGVNIAHQAARLIASRERRRATA